MLGDMILNDKVYFGYDVIKKISLMLNEKLIKKVILLSNEEDKEKFDFIKKSQKIEILNITYDETIKPKKIIEKISDKIENENVECIIAFGNKTIINIGKLIARNNKKLSIIMIPKELFWKASRNTSFVLTDEKNMKNYLLKDKNSENITTIVDFNITRSMPKTQLLKNCLYSLFNSIDNYSENESSLISDILNLNSCALISKNIKLISNDLPYSIEEVACAEFICGTGAPEKNSLAKIMKMSFDLYLGDKSNEAFGIVFPHIFDKTHNKNPEILENIIKAIDPNQYIKDDILEERMKKILKYYLKKSGFVENLSSINIPKEILPTIAKQTVKDIKTLKTMSYISETEILEILRKAY